MKKDYKYNILRDIILFLKSQSKLIIFATIFLFLLTRYFIFSAPITFSDVFYYAEIGYQSYSYENFFFPIYNVTDFEYPPITAVFLEVPNLFISQKGLIFEDYTTKYMLYYRAMMLVIDCLILLGIFLIVNKLDKTQKNLKFLAVTLIYSISTSILYTLVYDRIDLILALLILYTYYFQIQRKYNLSATFLTLGVFLKLIPLILIPIWIITWVPNGIFLDRNLLSTKNIFPILKSTVALVLSFISILVSSILIYGWSVFNFLSYHETRGIQVESFYSSIIHIFHFFGLPYNIENSYGSQNVASVISPILSTVSPMLIIAGTVYIAVKYLLLKSRNVALKGFLERDNYLFIAKVYTLSIMCLFTFSKVLSTQYFLLLIPFMSILLYNFSYSLTILWLFLLCLTTLIFPILYQSDIISVSISGLGTSTTLGTAILLSRNFLLAYFFFYLFRNFSNLESNSQTFFSRKTWNDKVNFVPIILLFSISTILLFINALT